MAKYKCINCGETKESEKQSICPVCGHCMFLVPYDRRRVLVSEIKRYINQLETKNVNRDDLTFENINKAKTRFPDFDKLVSFVSGKKTTEDYLDTLSYVIEQITEHFQKQFSKELKVSFDLMCAAIERKENVLKLVLDILAFDQSETSSPVIFPESTLYYSEIQNKYLWLSAKELIEKIGILEDKVVRFIKMYNLYGSINHYCHERMVIERDKDDIDWKTVLEERIRTVSSIIKKKYEIDIFDDGEEQLEEMLQCLWDSVETVMMAPLLIENYDFATKTKVFNENDYYAYLKGILEERYKAIDLFIESNDFLSKESENELFDIYCQIIKTDKFGFLVPQGTKIIDIGESEKKLNELIGLDSVKDTIKKIKVYALANKDSNDLNIHMCFLGNPGCGKTEVARYIAGILYENKVLPTNKLVEVDRSGLVSEYFGATAKKTSEVIEKAMGGVLLIDEAYALGNNSESGITDYGKEAIDTLVKAMEDNRGKFCVILAGYRNEMVKMLSVNPGFKSRIQFMLDFPNYSREELKSITELMLNRRNYIIGETAMNRILDITDVKRKEPNFANAREIRNILDQVIMCQNIRCAGTDDKELGIVDVNKYIQDSGINLPTAGVGMEDKILSGEEELDRLIGLSSVKRMIKKIKAYAKRNKGELDFNLHMCFYGNPGTGKTEVARILSRILYDAGVLNEAKLVETDGQGLLGKFVGETGPKTEAKINDAMNGVLFIDEAYSLIASDTFNGGMNYGDEAIAVLLKSMEDRRGQFCVILAGYKDKMQRMLSVNPGFESRIQFILDFPDYSREELGEIAKLFLAKKKYEIEPAALQTVLDVAEYYKEKPDFANARTIRNILDQVIMNQNVRTEENPKDRIIISDDVNEFILDEKIDLGSFPAGKPHIGFV